VASSRLRANDEPNSIKRLACIYFPDGVGMPLPEDPAYKDWSWFPHGNGTEFTFSKCGEPFEPLRKDLTILSGFSHPAVRKVHGHCNADQFLTAASTGTGGPYQNSISLDQVYAAHVGDQTRFSSIVMSTDGGTGTPRGAQTLSFDHNGRAIPAENRPKRVFDMLFVSSDEDAARRLALSKSALDDLMEDAASLRRKLNSSDQHSLDEYLESVREAERRVEKARHWINTPLPVVKEDHLKLDITPDEPRAYVQTMFELIYLAFKTDSTRVATYQIGRENGFGISDHLARAVGYTLAHSLTHETKNPDGWKRLGIYCQFLNEEFARFVTRLAADAGTCRTRATCWIIRSCSSDRLPVPFICLAIIRWFLPVVRTWVSATASTSTMPAPILRPVPGTAARNRGSWKSRKKTSLYPMSSPRC
jgi:hypothetical protein